MRCLARKKAKAKVWYEIIAPKVFNEMVIGKTMASDPELLIGRRITVSLMELTNNFSKYYMKFTFKIIKVEGDKAFTRFDGSECLRDYISRMVLRRVRRIDTIQDLTTKDGIKIRVKCITITSRKMRTNTEKIMRKKIQELVKEEVENSTLDEVVLKIVNDGIKQKVLKEARKIYPVRNFEVRKTEVLQQAKAQ